MSQDVEAALEAAFTAAPPKPEAQPEQAPAEETPLEAVAPLDEAAPEGEPEQEEQEAAPPPEPEFEVEIDGHLEVIQGADKIKEAISRGLKAGRQHEENARVREALAAQQKHLEASYGFQQAVMGDIAELRAIDAQLEQWNKVDWAAAFDADPFQAMKLKEQRDQLRENRNQKYQQLNFKHEQFVTAQKSAISERARAEEQALYAKLPEWRNAEKALPEKQAIVKDLADHYGFTSEEIGSLVDHRMLLVARDAMQWRELQRNKAEKVKQIRNAPPVVKPGAVVKQNGKAEFAKARGLVKAHGQKGNHRAQEALVTEMFNRAFKIS